MSIFRFTDLPEEIGTMVVQEVVNEYSSYPLDYKESHIDIFERSSSLKTLCIISSAFAKPAQSKLFEVINFANLEIIERFLTCIKSNLRLGLMVKEILIKFSIRASSISAYIGNIGEILDHCGSLERLTLAGQKISLELSILARAKNLQYLYLEYISINNSSDLFISPKLKFLRLHVCTFLASSSHILCPSTFPSLVSLELNHSSPWKGFHLLFPQVKNLSFSPLASFLEQDISINAFSNLEYVEFGLADTSLTITQALSRITSSLHAIRVQDNLLRIHFDWKALLEHILDRQTQSTLNLKSISIPSGHYETMIGCITEDMTSRMKGRGINIEIDEEGESFECWLKRVQKVK